MSYGFEIYDASGERWLSSTDLLISVLDVFQVAGESVGTRLYPGVGAQNVMVVQSPVKGTSLTTDAFMAFCRLNTVVTTEGANKRVTWSPAVRLGAVHDINLYVLRA